MSTTTSSCLMALFILFGFSLGSCKKDTTKGCTNTNAINYSSEANEDDGSCEFERDKFLGIWNGQKDCMFNPLDTIISVEIGPTAENFNSIIINNFPDVGLSAVAIVNASSPREFTINSQDITNDLDVYTLSGRGEVFLNTMVVNYYKTYDISSIDTCGLGITKME
ncbi:MAG: hypothetical protein WED33_11845 [Bacteroidia bacterium]